MIFDFLIFFVFIIAFFLLIIVLCALSGYLMHIRVATSAKINERLKPQKQVSFFPFPKDLSYFCSDNKKRLTTVT